MEEGKYRSKMGKTRGGEERGGEEERKGKPSREGRGGKERGDSPSHTKQALWQQSLDYIRPLVGLEAKLKKIFSYLECAYCASRSDHCFLASFYTGYIPFCMHCMLCVLLDQSVCMSPWRFSIASVCL